MEVFLCLYITSCSSCFKKKKKNSTKAQGKGYTGVHKYIGKVQVPYDQINHKIISLIVLRSSNSTLESL